MTAQKGAHLVIEAAFKHMGKDGDLGGKGGAVINLSSTAGITCVGEMFTVPAYTTSKHAVTTLTRTFGVNTYACRWIVIEDGEAAFKVDFPLDAWLPESGLHCICLIRQHILAK